jgi:hypothetical protein
MQTTDTQTADAPAQQRTRWARFLDTVLPAPSPDRLVRVAAVGRTALPLAEGSLADVGVSPVIQEITKMNGDSQFMILVSAKDSGTAAEVLADV